MTWGFPHSAGTGSMAQIEDAHNALDQLGVTPGPLAVRVLELVGTTDRIRTELNALTTNEHIIYAAVERDPKCVLTWPECEEGAYDPRCCRFPKSCSCQVTLIRTEG